MTEHVLKTIQPYFDAVASGEKTFEARRNDRAYQSGDVLVLWSPEGCTCDDPYCERRKLKPIKRQVTFVFAGDPSLRDLGGIVPGYVVLALSPEAVS